MDKLVKITVPDYVYRFYADASTHVLDCTAEALMADALSAYAGLLSDAVSRQREARLSKEGNEESVVDPTG